jgi:hypothetical protein
MEALKNLQPLMTLFFSLGTFVGMVIAVYKFSRDPDIKASERMASLEQGCFYKHEAVDKNFKTIQEDLKFLKENHIAHIERNIRNINLTQTKILTILEAKYQIKIENNEENN